MRPQFMPVRFVGAAIAPVFAVTCLVACGSSAKQATTTTAPGVITPQAPTQSQPTAAPTVQVATTTVAPTTSASPTTAVVTTTPPPQTYVIQAGDQLQRIANKFGVDIAELMRINGITNPDKINKGQTLIIPAPAPPASTLPA